jgi:hypothetical protein
MQSVFNIKRINNTALEKQVEDIQFKYDTLREHTTKLEVMNDQLRFEIHDFDNMRLQMSCVDIINKVLLTIIICYILTTTSHGFSKIISHGFSFFDWICFFMVIMTYTVKLPRLIYWFDQKKKKYNRNKKKPY